MPTGNSPTLGEEVAGTTISRRRYPNVIFQYIEYRRVSQEGGLDSYAKVTIFPCWELVYTYFFFSNRRDAPAVLNKAGKSRKSSVSPTLNL